MKPETVIEEKLHPMRTTLIKRLDSLSEELCLATFDLFDCLLAIRDEYVN